jgi:hypothetical protein
VEDGGKMTLLKVYDSKITPSFAFVNLVCKKRVWRGYNPFLTTKRHEKARKFL